MPAEVLEYLNPQPGQIFADGTLGGGGHTRLLAERVGTGGRVLAMDRDGEAITAAEQSLPRPPVIPLHGSYHRLGEAIEQLDIPALDGLLLDLGLSSDQLEDPRRGFSFHSRGPLDLRFDVGRGSSAADLLARLPEKEIADLIYQFGEERFSRRIARRIVERRRAGEPIRRTEELAELVRRCVPRAKHHTIDPATRTFQALRIAVNDELGILGRALDDAAQWLRPGGVLVAISFHSLEDRLVKHALRNRDRWEVLTKKPRLPAATEVSGNPRARSAKLRAARRRPAIS
jgi:16S rRNA (cytosine1402-N4)-methyltransferase